MEMNIGHESIFLGENVTSGVSFFVFLQNMGRLVSAHQGKRDIVHPQYTHIKDRRGFITCTERNLLGDLRWDVFLRRRPRAIGGDQDNCREQTGEPAFSAEGKT